jgi:hypothetical protein
VARAWYMSRLWVPNFVLAASLVRARFERADWATMGNHIPATGVLGSELINFSALTIRS